MFPPCGQCQKDCISELIRGIHRAYGGKKGPVSWSCSSAAMKFSLVAALVVVLAVSHGTEAVSLVKRDVQSEVDRIAKIINDMSAVTQEMVEKVKALEVTNTAQTYLEDTKAKILPLVEKVQAEATKLQDQVRPFIANIEDQMRPLTDNFNAQVKPLTDKIHAQVKPLADNFQAQVQPLADNFQAQVKPLADNFQAQVKPLTDMMEKFFQQVMDQTKALLPPQ
ncbi:Type-4 ice-structuring protein LS-12 [Nibea albiflora]|uniref:Type-4 ice-structuring protein LS-12 n=1 Tax=Nibea albiflora TaxID=240163 RepID=A0ACB7F6Q9_NIBAL|nr:Type-4 ice-structuring protein LS-12 [Nibea albiflora]